MTNFFGNLINKILGVNLIVFLFKFTLVLSAGWWLNNEIVLNYSYAASALNWALPIATGVFFLMFLSAWNERRNIKRAKSLREIK